MATWQDECRARGGVVTVMPTPGDYTPACRIRNQDGSLSYLDLRSMGEVWDDDVAIAEDNWSQALGTAVTIRDSVVATATSAFKWSFATLAIAGGIAIALFAAIEKKK